jgi:UDP-N-acetylglucosamine:LPS N-acetylglucosamine transferase
MRVTIISAFDPIPGDDAQLIRYASLAHIFAKENHQVDYFTSSFFHLNKIQRKFTKWQDPQFQSNISLHIIKTNSYKKNISLFRLINHYIFAFSLKIKFRSLVKTQKPDLVIVAFPPVMSAYHIVNVCNKNQIPVVIDVQDLWPEAFRMVIHDRFMFSIALHRLLIKRKFAFKNASRISCVSETYREYLSKYQPKANIQVVKLGFDTGLFRQNYSADWNFLHKSDSDKWVVYLGTASHNPDLNKIPDIAAEMPGYTFILLGKNQGYKRIQHLIHSRNLKNVLVLGNSSFSNIVNILYRSDAGILFIDKRSGTSLPNKLFYYMLAGLPVISNYRNHDLEILSERLNCVFFADTGNHQDMIGSITKASGISATDKNNLRNFAFDNFDTEKIYRSYYNWVSDIKN